MKRHDLFLAAGIGLLAGTVGAQTTGYLYYAGGAIATTGEATAQDGTLTTDNGVFSVLVATVSVDGSSIIVDGWKYAAGASLGNPLPEDHPATVGTEEKYTWLFTENGVHVYNGRLYIGPGDWNGDGSRSTAPVVAHAPINADGTLGAWTLSDIFPTPPADQAICATALVDFGGGNAYYYVLGGTGSGTDRVLVSKIQPDGSLGTWSATTAPLPVGDWFNRATAVGGSVIHASGNLATTVTRATHYAAPNSGTGDIASWTSSGQYDAGGLQWDMAMTSARSGGGNDFAVIAAGSGLDGKVFVSQVTGGVPGAWSETNALSTFVRRVTATSVDDVVFVMGGTVGASGVAAATSKIQVGRISDAGVITWTDSDAEASIDAMPQARGFGGAAFHPAVLPASVDDAWQMYQ